MNTKGFTLLEMMIATVITVIVGAAGFSFFTNTFNFSVSHGRNMGMQRESRMALDIMAREIRSAGFGVANPLAKGAVYPAAAANVIVAAGNNSGTGASDQITLWGGFQTVGSLTCPAPPCINPVVAFEGANQIFVKALAGVDPTAPTLVGTVITLDGFFTGTVTAVAGPFGVAPAQYYTLTLDRVLTRDFSQNNGVTALQRIAYNVLPDATGQPALFRGVNGAAGQIIASGIEDLQFSYLLNDGTTVNLPPAAAATTLSPVRAVQVGMLARAQDPSPGANAISNRPALGDHAAAAALDRFHRRLIQKVVEVRNLGY